MPTNINGNSGIDRIQDGSVHNVDIDSVDFSKIVGDSSSVGLIRQWKMTSSPTQNIAITAAAGTTGATSGTYTGAEIAMTPKDINSWFSSASGTLAEMTLVVEVQLLELVV